MAGDSVQRVDLKAAQRMILEKCAVLSDERVLLGESLYRYPAR